MLLPLVAGRAPAPSIEYPPAFFAGATVALAAQDPVGVPLPAAAAHAGEVRQVTYDASGRWLVSADDKVIKVWGAADGKRLAAALVEGGIEALRASPSEPLLAVLRGDYSVELRSLPALTIVRSWPTGDFTSGLAFSHDGALVATCAYGGVRFWSTSTGIQARRLELQEVFDNVAFSPDGILLATTGRADLMGGSPRLSLWRLSDFSRLRTAGSYREGAYFTLSFTADGGYLAAGTNNDQYSLWPVPSLEPAAIKAGRPYGLRSVVAGTDPTTLLSADGGRLRVWTVPEGTERLAFEAHAGPIRAVAPSPDKATFASGGADRAIRIWRLSDGSIVRVLDDSVGVKKEEAAAAAASAKAVAAAAAAAVSVSGRLVHAGGEPVRGRNLKLPVAVPSENGGLFYAFAPDFYEATTGDDGRFRFAAIKSGATYALVDLSSGRPSPMKRADGSVLLLEIAKGAKNIDLGEIRFGD